jgi:CRISPR-associated endonuclease Cas3-HD
MIGKIEELSEFVSFNHLLSYAELKNGEMITEEFAEHSLRALRHWNALKGRVLANLSRILNQSKENVDLCVSLAVLLHDAGKLTTRYQDYLNEKREAKISTVGFRHEVVSTQVLLDCLNQTHFDDAISWLVVGAVLFHHEALKQRELRRRVDSLISPLYNMYPRGVVSFVPLTTELLKKLTNITLKLDFNFREELSIEYLKVKLVRIFQFFDPDNSVDLHIRRLKVSAIHQIVSVCDNRAAYEARPRRNYPFMKEVVEGGWKYGDCNS